MVDGRNKPAPGARPEEWATWVLFGVPYSVATTDVMCGAPVGGPLDSLSKRITEAVREAQEHVRKFEKKEALPLIPVGEPFEEALRSFLHYVEHQNLSGLDLSKAIAIFIRERKRLGHSYQP